jgi:hypothetical protein
MSRQLAVVTGAKRASILALVITSVCAGQNTENLQQGTIVTGQCYFRQSQPGCVLPNLFGPQGLTLVPAAFSHYAHFIGSAQTTLNQTLSTAIATQLATLPLISPSSGFTYEYDSAAGAFVRSTTSFGPVYTERAETIGRGKISVGSSYQRFRFQNLDGIDLHKIPAVFTHVPDTGPGGVAEPYELDFISTVNSLDLKLDQTTLFATIGVTDWLDASIAVPFISTRISASSFATIVRVSGTSNIPTTVAPGVIALIPNPHEFSTSGATTNTYSSSGSAAGIGDVTLRFKAAVYRGENVRVSFATDIRLPTGDEFELLGSGAAGVKPFVIISTGKRFSPHVNLGYQFNGKSYLAGDITGTSSPGAGIVNSNGTPLLIGTPTKRGLPDQFFYSAGFDYGVTRRLSLAVDYLGQTLIDAPRVFKSTFNSPGAIGIGGIGALGPQSVPTVTPGTDTVGINNGSVGVKYNLFGQLLLTGDILFRLDNKGLRQDVTPLIALSYAFAR